MLRRTLSFAGVLVCSLVLLYLTAGKPLSDCFGLVRASAGQTLQTVTDNVPASIRDRQLMSRLKDEREEMLNREATYLLGEKKMAELADRVAKLKAALERRKKLLAEAYPILHEAVASGRAQILFARRQYATPDFEKFIDDLIEQQDRQTNELNDVEPGLHSMVKSQSAGRTALAEHKSALDRIGSEIETLIRRRDQAKCEATTLELIEFTQTAHPSAEHGVMAQVAQLKDDVQLLEAKNAARRTSAATAGDDGASQMARDYSRLETLRRYTDHDSKTVRSSSELSTKINCE